MAKKSIKIWMVVIAVALIVLGSTGALNGLGLFSTLGPGDYAVGSSCAIATSQYTHGAQQGECFIYTLSNQNTLLYVESVIEKSSTCSISPSCPDGTKKSCTINSNANWEDIFTCDVAKTSSNDIKVCMYDSDCSSQNCVAGLCKSGLPSTCSVTGETRCASESKYQTCLSGHFSGLLTCESGTSCYVDRCMTPNEIAILNQGGTNTDNGTNTGTGNEILGMDTNTLLIIGGIILLLLSIL